MNKIILMGRLTKEVTTTHSQSATPIVISRYTLAVNRRFKRDGEPDADFINIVAFGKQGEFAEKFLQKGKQICVVGSIKTGSYEKDGRKIYTTDVVAEEQYFAESKKSEGDRPQTPINAPSNGFVALDDDFDESELPF